MPLHHISHGPTYDTPDLAYVYTPTQQLNRAAANLEFLIDD